MPLGDPTEEDLDLQIQVGLLGHEVERRDATTKLFNRYKERLMIWLENKHPLIPADDLATAVHNAFIEVYRMAEERPKALDDPLRPLLFTIADRRAVDEARKYLRRIRANDEIAKQIGEALDGTDTGAAWRAFCTSNENHSLGRAIREEFRAFAATLPRKQKLVAGVLVNDLLQCDGDIVSELRTRNIVVTTIEVKGAKQALMKKFREILKKKGIR
jgi:DNA-directed RNA polymerase specialized sigma24 family protein